MVSAGWPETLFLHPLRALPSTTPEGIWAEPAKGPQAASRGQHQTQPEARLSRGLGKDSGRKGVYSLSLHLESSARADRENRSSAGELGPVTCGRRHWDSAPGRGSNREGDEGQESLELPSPLACVRSHPCCRQRGEESEGHPAASGEVLG